LTAQGDADLLNEGEKEVRKKTTVKRVFGLDLVGDRDYVSFAWDTAEQIDSLIFEILRNSESFRIRGPKKEYSNI